MLPLTSSPVKFVLTKCPCGLIIKRELLAELFESLQYMKKG
jgi:hypothetical protein